jgi:hypothetical protein
MTARMILRKCVSGKTSPSALRPFRHAAKREHEARQQQRRQEEEEGELHRLHLGPRQGGKRVAQQHQRQHEDQDADQQQPERADERHAEQRFCSHQHHQDLDAADDQEGQHLAQHDLQRARRHGKQVLHGPAFRLPRQRHRGHHHHRQLQDHPQQTRNNVVLGNAFGIVELVHDHIECRG